MAKAGAGVSVGARHGREYWRSVVEQWRRSGLGQAEFCRQHEIARGSLSFWKYTFSREAERTSEGPRTSATGARGTVLLPVRIAPPSRVAVPWPTPVPNERGGEIEIVTHDGRLVRVRGRVERQWLADVLSTVESARC